MSGEADLAISLEPIENSLIRCAHLMDERLAISVPQGHRLASRKSASPDDLRGETFIMYRGVGFWEDVTKEALSGCEFIMQEDYRVMEQLAVRSAALSFVSDAPYQRHPASDRPAIAFDHPCAQASFYLLVRNDASSSVLDVFDRVATTAVRRTHARTRS